MDTDELAASKFGLSISEILSKHGEERFREVETQVLRNLAPDQPTIVVTGGGIVLRRENVDLLKGLGVILWLTADEETLFERASRRRERPLLKTENPKETFSELLRVREPLYASAADLRVDTSALSQDEVTEEILRKMDNVSVARR